MGFINWKDLGLIGLVECNSYKYLQKCVSIDL